MQKRIVQLAQVNYQYGNNVFLPHSAGMLQAYAESFAEIQDNFQFLPILFLRENPADVVKRVGRVDVLGLSCYVWNWQWNKTLAQAYKAAYPECMVVMGGPQIPDKCAGFFDGHPYVDVLVHGEGEDSFAALLRQMLPLDAEHHHYCVGDVETALSPRRIDDLGKLKSPYTAGVYDAILRDHPTLTFNATQETHRGCPYSCTFCDWGSATFTKVRQFPDTRLLGELEWFGQNKIEFLCNADANYGLLPRDKAFTQALVNTKAKYGYPKRFKAAWAKNSSERMFELSGMLHTAGMDKGVTLSLQSLHPPTLELIKRKNIEMDNFAELIQRYQRAGIPTYTELILGLPGETYESFVTGICKLLDAGCHEGINIYPCSLFVNAEMSTPEYVRLHGLQTVVCPILQNHSSPGSDDIQELDRVVIGTNTMPPEDWHRAFMFSWAVQTFHSLGLLQHIARQVNRTIGYREFYEGLLAYMARSNNWLGVLYEYADRTTASGMKGQGWGHRTDKSKFGDIWWPIEEMTFLDVVAGDLDAFYTETRHWLLMELQVGIRDVIRLAAEQRAMIVTPADYPGSTLEDFAREVVWYGRKGGKFLKKAEVLHSHTPPQRPPRESDPGVIMKEGTF
jgi:putative methyltransferase